MKRTELQSKLRTWDERGRRVFTTRDLRKMFPNGTPDSFIVRLGKLCADPDPVICRATRGVYVFNHSTRPKTNLIEEIARTIRRGAHNYVSLECALSEYGLISQIPVGVLTVMTTGRSGYFSTPWGDIEFTHTSRSWTDFVDDTTDVDRPLKMASPRLAFRDLTNVDRNLHLVDVKSALLKSKNENPDKEEVICDAEF